MRKVLSRAPELGVPGGPADPGREDMKAIGPLEVKTEEVSLPERDLAARKKGMKRIHL